MQNGTRLAAVDLGSNSFRLEIGQVDHGQIHRTEYLKETVPVPLDGGVSHRCHTSFLESVASPKGTTSYF